jgi:YhcH/YjgK/YiaL family protein
MPCIEFLRQHITLPEISHMILDDFKNYQLFVHLGPLFKTAFEFIEKTDLMSLPLGKHSIQGDDLFVILMEYETKDPSQAIMENHKKYIDIQYMVLGEELMGVQTFHGQPPTTAYDETKEAAFYKPEYDSLLKVKEGHFTIFFPQDLHMTSIKSGERATIRKAVFKVKA